MATFTFDSTRAPHASADTLDNILDTLAGLGARLDRPEIKRARKSIERARATRREIEGNIRGATTTTAARDYAAGTADLDDLRAAALTAELSKDRTSILNKTLDSAARHCEADARNHLADLGDTWVTGILRPVVDDLAAQVLADIPPAMAASIYPPTRPGDDAAADLLTGRLDAQVAHGRLRQAHATATQLRQLRCIPATERDTSCWEWSTSLGERQYAGDDLATFVYLAHRGHRAGIYTDPEADAAEAANPSVVLTPSDLAAARARASGAYAY
ncbi:MAG: hypothetical protein ACTHXO_13745 [Actinomycetaceae bacterium]